MLPKQITSSIDLWYDDEWYTGERDIRITYTNVDVSGLSKGDMVTQGDIIGKVTDSRLCGTVSNPNIGTYIHFQVELDYWSGYHSIDPRLLIK